MASGHLLFFGLCIPSLPPSPSLPSSLPPSLPSLFPDSQERFGEELPLRKLGFTGIVSLLSFVEQVCDLERPLGSSDWLVFKKGAKRNSTCKFLFPLSNLCSLLYCRRLQLIKGSGAKYTCTSPLSTSISPFLLPFLPPFLLHAPATFLLFPPLLFPSIFFPFLPSFLPPSLPNSRQDLWRQH